MFALTPQQKAVEREQQGNNSKDNPQAHSNRHSIGNNNAQSKRYHYQRKRRLHVSQNSGC